MSNYHKSIIIDTIVIKTSEQKRDEGRLTRGKKTQEIIYLPFYGERKRDIYIYICAHRFYIA